MDPLKQILLNRLMTKEPTAPSGLPAPIPNKQSHLPPAFQRYLTGLKMQKAIRAGWDPHPTLVKILEG